MTSDTIKTKIGLERKNGYVSLNIFKSHSEQERIHVCTYIFDVIDEASIDLQNKNNHNNWFYKHELFVYFIIFLKDCVPILFTLQLQCWELSHSILVHVLYQWLKRHASGLWFVRVTLNANVGAVVAIPCSVCMHLKRQGNCGNSHW